MCGSAQSPAHVSSPVQILMRNVKVLRSLTKVRLNLADRQALVEVPEADLVSLLRAEIVDYYYSCLPAYT